MNRLIYMALIAFFVTSTASASSAILVCDAEGLSLALERGQDSLGSVAYVVGSGALAKRGSFEALINTNPNNAGYLSVLMMDSNQADRHRRGIEGGILGFASFDTNEKTTRAFKAVLTIHMFSQSSKIFEDFDGARLNCRMP